jgi:hypothetical protein
VVSANARRKVTWQALLVLLVVSVGVLGGAEAASAKSPVIRYFIRPSATSTVQAGGHPDITSEFAVGNRISQGNPPPCDCDDPKILIQDFPTGVIGNPHATPQCDEVQMAAKSCPIDSQIGIVAVLIGTELGAGTGYFYFPLYNLIPHPGEAGLVAFNAPTAPIYTALSARTGSDYGLRAETKGLERGFPGPPFAITTYLWGVPADPVHDVLRFGESGQGAVQECILGIGDPRPYFEKGELPPPSQCPATEYDHPHHSTSPLAPFLSNPTTCGGTLTSSFESLAFDNERDRAETTYPAITGCDQLQFNPSLAAKPTTTETDSATGLDVDLSVPQFSSALTPSPSELKATTVTLPPGFSINPNAADGKTTCSDTAANFGSEAAADCPDFAKIGTVLIDSSALPGPIPGYLYLGDPEPGNRYRLVLVADGFATHLKLAGSVKPDPGTGQLTFSFPDLPQSPLTDFKLHVFGSERGVLATPTQCGTYPVHSTFKPWDDSLAEQSSTQFFTLDQGPSGTPCPTQPRSFSSSFDAASTGNTGGAHSPFAIELGRGDGEQYLSGLEVRTPPGFSATLRGIPYCPESAITQLGMPGYTGLSELAASSCPAASQVGTANAGTGAGSRPLYIGGKVYLAGPYKGAPLSLVVVVPAVSGPYDLGNVVVRAALEVDPVTAQVTAVSDPLPQIVEGIPLRTKSVQVKLDRPNFTLNPTDCAPSSVEATIHGAEGAVQTRTSPFQVANCAKLPYQPRLSMSLSGGVKRRGHPAIDSTFTSQPGEANSRFVTVVLPKGELLDNAHFGSVCTRVDFEKGACPANSHVGDAAVSSPLLDKPLTGSVYLRANPEHELPDLAIDLKGQIDFTVVGHVDSVNERFRARFETLPDVPVGAFSLDLLGGSKGLLQNSEALCGKPKRALVKAIGQNEAVSTSRPRLRIACGSKQRSKRHHRRNHGVGRGAGEGH